MINFSFQNPSQTSSTLTIVVSVWFNITSLVILYLTDTINLTDLIWGILRFDLYHNGLIYHCLYLNSEDW